MVRDPGRSKVWCQADLLEHTLLAEAKFSLSELACEK